MLAGVLASAIESIGDYYACARLAGKSVILQTTKFFIYILNIDLDGKRCQTAARSRNEPRDCDWRDRLHSGRTVGLGQWNDQLLGKYRSHRSNKSNFNFKSSIRHLSVEIESQSIINLLYKVGSRRVIQAAALMMMFFGLMSKFGALFITIPEPIIGGIFCVMFGMIAATGMVLNS